MEKSQQQRKDDGLGWSWIHVVITAIIALLVARYAIRTYMKIDNHRHSAPSMKYNSTTLYPALYISDDGKTITNRPTHFTQRISSGPTHLHRYTGVLLNKHLDVFQTMHIELVISYRVVSGDDGMILCEVGFEEREEIDKLLYLRNTWGTIYVRISICLNENGIHVCLSASDGKLTYSTYTLSDASVDGWFDLRLAFHINPDDDVIKVMYSLDKTKAPNELVYKFIDADINENKWPVFATYNPHLFHVHMTLNNVKNMWFDHTTIHPMVYISEDKLELSNVPTKTTSRFSYRLGQFQKYEGTVANVSFSVDKALKEKWPKKIYFDVNLQYNVTEFLLTGNFLFEIGLSRFKYIDKYWTVSSHRYSVSVYGCGCHKILDICLFAWKDGKKNLIGILSKGEIGAQFTGDLRFSLDFEESKVTLSMTSYTYVFNDVDLTELMWPVFALYKHGVDTMLTLK